ncbi:hypothetical protein AVEN_212816-1 [Araneus ventricosus]|uniref:Uncharacterized protein n=1 Tax=Araneus ventricosus TaxID=182803 RepID=A0A4Y2NUC1_ARAVE|nr:hypothetical protein AVEN_212816-1 [Araneus ventricosus]
MTPWECTTFFGMPLGRVFHMRWNFWQLSNVPLQLRERQVNKFLIDGGVVFYFHHSLLELALLAKDILPNSLLPVALLIPSGDWTFQQINASDAYSVLYKILYAGERGKDSSMAILEFRPESNGRSLGHSGSIFLQEWAAVQKQI